MEEIARPGGDELPSLVSGLILYGELADDVDLRSLLGSVLGPQLVEEEAMVFMFASSTGLARLSFANMDEIDFPYRAKAAWGCQWRSGLY